MYYDIILRFYDNMKNNIVSNLSLENWRELLSLDFKSLANLIE